MIRRYQCLIGLHFSSLLLLVGNPLLAFHFWSKRDANRTVDTGSVNIDMSFFFFLKRGLRAVFWQPASEKPKKQGCLLQHHSSVKAGSLVHTAFFVCVHEGGMTSALQSYFFCFYDNAHPIRIGTRSPCGKRNQGRRTVIVVNVIFAKNWLQYVCTCCT